MAESAVIRYMTDYHAVFDPKSYLNGFYTFHKENESQKGFLEDFLKVYHKFWSNFNPVSSSSKDATTVRCLEYGGGPSVASLISASPKVDRIVFSEYTEANRKAVMSWITGKPEAHDWSPVIQFVVHDLENNGAPHAVSNREEEMKRKIQSIVPCDVTKNPIVDLESGVIDELFDVVSTTLCLEASVNSEQEYKSTVAKLCNFLKPNGYLFMQGVLDETFYAFGDGKFHAFPLTQAMVEEAMKDAGLEEITFEPFERKLKLKEASNAKSFYFAFGKLRGNPTVENKE